MAADAVAPDGRIIGSDISVPMLRGALAKLGARPIRLVAMRARYDERRARRGAVRVKPGRSG